MSRLYNTKHIIYYKWPNLKVINSKYRCVCIGYSTIETKEAAVLDITGFFFRMSTQVKAGFLFPHEYSGEALVLMRKKKPVISNTGKLFCFNNNVSNLYNNSVVEKINCMAYIFTLLMFRKSNKTTINKK